MVNVHPTLGFAALNADDNVLKRSSRLPLSTPNGPDTTGLRENRAIGRANQVLYAAVHPGQNVKAIPAIRSEATPWPYAESAPN